MSQAANGPSQAAKAAGAPVVVVEDLRKRYGNTTAVDGISFAVYRGETFGLLGPNGAGKSTTLAVMSGLLRPDAGDVLIDGVSVRLNVREAQAMIGVVPQSLAIYEDLTGKQNLSYFAKLRGIPRSESAREIERVLDIVALADDAGKRVAKYSGGMKRRLNIAVGLLGRPKVLLLDEPTVGIDPQSRRHILDSVRRLADQGMTIIYTSHYMEEVEYLCRRVAIMDRGRIIAQGPVDEVRALAGDSVTLILPRSSDALGNDLDVDGLRRAAGVPVEIGSAEVRFLLPEGSRQAPELIGALRDYGVPLDGMRLETPNLETVFLSLTGKALRDLSSTGGEPA